MKPEDKQNTSSDGQKAPASIRPLEAVEGPELVFALVGAVGTDLSLVGEVLEAELGRVGYGSTHVRISQLMHALDPSLPDPGGPEDERYDKHMQVGTEIRSKLQRGDALALLAISAIRNERHTSTGDGQVPIKRGAYIIRSLKHPTEVSTLRNVYGRAFFLVAAYSSYSDRREKLAHDIAKSRYAMAPDQYRAAAEELIARDEEEHGNKLGQRLRDTFHLADVFVDARNRGTIEREIRRFVELVFAHPFHTPTVDEFAMFHAHATALRSADLSRQVGAAIFNSDGSLVAVGCNEVPKAGGGAYWPGDINDRRDFQLGYDPSARVKQRLLEEVLNQLQKGGWLGGEKAFAEIRSLVQQALHGDSNPLLSGARLMDLLEFGRIVHAEMAALTDAARRGVSITGSTLYCTTFPCHMCARHIVASGISEVLYVEPYPKSMAKDLYPDSIAVEEPDAASKVKFRPFVGIAPSRFAELFAKPDRKSRDGTVLRWEPASAIPRLRRFVLSYLLIEVRTAEEFGALLRQAGYKFGIREGGEGGKPDAQRRLASKTPGKRRQ